MIQANVHEAKSQLSKLIERAEAGEEVVIARNGKPAVRLQPIAPAKPASWLGMFAGKMGRAPTWEEWKKSDREVAKLFEEHLAEEEPGLPPPEVSEERLAQLDTLSTPDLLQAVTLRPR